VSVPPPEPNPEAPLTLDLRRPGPAHLRTPPGAAGVPAAAGRATADLLE